jgi:hypothetical protein
MICWVRPGVLLVCARVLIPVITLIALDLPTLERPAKATSLPSSGGSWVVLWTATRKIARRSNAVFFRLTAIPYVGIDLLFLCKAN